MLVDERNKGNQEFKTIAMVCALFLGKETEVVKQMYESELKEARDLYNDSEKEKARIELKIQSLEDQIAEYRRRFVTSKYLK